MKLILTTALLIAITGCSSIIEGTSQQITINTTPDNADCTLKRQEEILGHVNPTPGSILIKKTKYDIMVTCKKPGYQNATFLNHSGAAGATVGNVLLGGGIGWAIDSAAGADNKYDTPLNITLIPNEKNTKEKKQE